MRRNRLFAFAGTAATLWAGFHALVYFDRGGPLGPGSIELPLTIRLFFVAAICAGILGGVALAFRRHWAASLLWISWLGVLIEGSWAPGLYGDLLRRGPIDFGLATVFAVAAQWATGRKTFQTAGKASGT